MRHTAVIVVLFLTGPIFISEAYGGHIVSEGQTCAGLSGDRCEEDLYCDIPWGGGPFPPGSLCGASDAPGTCVKVMQDCPLTPKEVCGCDGKTYLNDCIRIRAHAQKAGNGKCSIPP
jgi:Kazal-type serine protease inhibitor domain